MDIAQLLTVKLHICIYRWFPLRRNNISTQLKLMYFPRLQWSNKLTCQSFQIRLGLSVVKTCHSQNLPGLLSGKSDRENLIPWPPELKYQQWSECNLKGQIHAIISREKQGHKKQNISLWLSFYGINYLSWLSKV